MDILLINEELVADKQSDNARVFKQNEYILLISEKLVDEDQNQEELGTRQVEERSVHIVREHRRS